MSSSLLPRQIVYLLPLADDGSPDVPGGYIYLPPPTDPPYILRFATEGTSPICHHGSFWENTPGLSGKQDVSQFREHK